jgi:membrane peptidoglycan carboxypeptidase
MPDKNKIFNEQDYRNEDTWRDNNLNPNNSNNPNFDNLKKETLEENFVIPGISTQRLSQRKDSQANFRNQKDLDFYNNSQNSQINNSQNNPQENSFNYQNPESQYDNKYDNFEDPEFQKHLQNQDIEEGLDQDLENEKPKNLWQKIPAFFKKHRKLITSSFLFLFVVGILGGAFVGVWALGIYNSINNVVDSATRISEGSIIFDRNNKEMFRYAGDIKREKVGSDKIPENMKLAIVSLEDENFYQNQMGIPWQNMAGAVFKCGISRGKSCRGGSGLSQQLIKNVKQDDEASLDRKVRELFTAIKFNQELEGDNEQKQDKTLELYLNWVPFGRNTYGVKTAMQSYFGKDVEQELSIPEACYLASMPQRPTTFAEGIKIELKNREKKDKNEELAENPGWEILQARKNACIQNLYEKPLAQRGTAKAISSQEEANKLQEETINFKSVSAQEQKYPHIQTYLLNELKNNFSDGEITLTEQDLQTQGYKIYTSFDINIQDKAQKIVSESKEVELARGNNAAAMILDGPTGEVIAMIGSKDFNNEKIQGQVNITTSPRQPGSSYKPYVYTAAFENGFNPSTTLLDVQTNFGGYTPKNFSGTFSGITTIRKSLQDSLNIPAVKGAFLTLPDGTVNPNTEEATNNILNFAEKIGVEHPYKKNCGLSSALGGCEVTMISHATGINTILQGGVERPARPILKIQKDGFDVFNEVQLSNKYPSKQAINTEVARQTTNVMSDYASRSPNVWGNTRFNLQLEGWNGENSVAAKTGTTNDVKDLWTVGGSPYYTVTVWAGNTDGKPMDPKASSSTVAASIWNRIMKDIHSGKEKKGFSKEGLTPVSLDPITGLLAENGKTELLTQKQITSLNQAQKSLNNPSYNPMQNSIISNRTPVTGKKVKINKLDGKLIANKDDKKTENSDQDNSQNIKESDIPAELVEEKTCIGVVSEFPRNSDWLKNAQTISIENTSCPTEISNLDKNSLGPKITSNLSENAQTSLLLGLIQIEAATQAKAGEDSNSITEITFSVGGELIKKVNNQTSLSLDIKEEKITGIKDVLITATDKFGFKTQLTLNKIDFDKLIPKSSSSSSSKSSSSNLSLPISSSSKSLNSSVNSVISSSSST